MDQDVSLQVHVLHEPLPADLTQEASLFVVEADMSVQRLFLGEALPAEAAGERLLPRVDLKVRLQVAALVEGLPAVAAGVWFFSSVDPQVHLQRCVGWEAFPAHVARVAKIVVGAQVSCEAGGGLVLASTQSTAAVGVLQVSLHMFHQERSLVESVPAHFAAVQLRWVGFLGFVLLLVAHHVPLQTSPLTELLAADAAGVHLLAAVLLHVSLQRRQVTKGAAALFAFEGLLHGVDANVRLQVALLAELLAADVAAVRLLSGVQPQVQLLRQNGLEGFPAEGAGFTAVLVRLQVSRQITRRA